jgi:uncharacterized membrane protein
MFRALRRYLNAFLIGFIVTAVVYLFVRFDTDAVFLGILIGAAGGVTALVAYIYLDRKFGTAEILYDKDGNPVRR